MKIAIVKLSAIGDVVHALPLARLLRRRHPTAQITWIIERHAAHIIKGLTDIDETLVIDTREPRRLARAKLWFEGMRSVDATRSQLTNVMPHWSIDAQGLIKSGLVSWAMGAPLRTGFPAAMCRERGNALFTNDRPPVRPGLHVIESMLELLGPEWTPPPPEDLALPLFPGEGDAVRNWTQDARRGHQFLVALNPSASWVTKRWPLHRFEELLTAFSSRADVRFVVLWGPGERETAEILVNHHPARALLAPDLSLRELYGLLSNCDLYVGGDTGPMHLAAAAGTAAVGIFGPTDPARNGPYGANTISLWRRRQCSPCHKRACDHGEDCLDSLPAAPVIAAVSRMLAAIGQGAQCSERIDVTHGSPDSVRC